MYLEWVWNQHTHVFLHKAPSLVATPNHVQMYGGKKPGVFRGGIKQSQVFSLWQLTFRLNAVLFVPSAWVFIKKDLWVNSALTHD